jgi:hypothetical protein
MLKLLRLPFLTDLRIAVGPASRLRRRYADAPAAAFLFSFLSMPAVRLNFLFEVGACGPQAVKAKPL